MIPVARWVSHVSPGRNPPREPASLPADLPQHQPGAIGLLEGPSAALFEHQLAEAEISLADTEHPVPVNRRQGSSTAAARSSSSALDPD